MSSQVRQRKAPRWDDGGGIHFDLCQENMGNIMTKTWETWEIAGLEDVHVNLRGEHGACSTICFVKIECFVVGLKC